MQPHQTNFVALSLSLSDLAGPALGLAGGCELGGCGLGLGKGLAVAAGK